MLPGMDGWRIIEDARRGPQAPVIVVSARGSEQDKVHALRLGADDYLAKPFGMAELVARVQAVLRRSRLVATAEDSREPIEAPGLVIDPDLHCALVDGHDAGLTALEFRLLIRAGVRARAGAHPRSAAAAGVGRALPASRPLGGRVRAQAARKARPAGHRHTYIHTHYGVGYRFEAVVREPVPA